MGGIERRQRIEHRAGDALRGVLHGLPDIDQQYATLLEQRLDFGGVVLRDSVGGGMAHVGIVSAAVLGSGLSAARMLTLERCALHQEQYGQNDDDEEHQCPESVVKSHHARLTLDDLVKRPYGHA